MVVPFSVTRVRGDDTPFTTLTFSGLLTRAYIDTYLNTYVDAIQAGNVLTFNVIFTANSYVYQRNLTMGVKFDWMTNYQNTTSDVAVSAGQTVTVSLPYTIPNLTGQYANLNQAAHSWTLELWDMQQGAIWNQFGCSDPNSSTPPFQPSCHSFNSGYPHNLAIYSSAQASSFTNNQQATAMITALTTSLRTSITPVPGTSQAVSLIAQAETQQALGDTAYKIGDFNSAQTDYQNAFNDANAAQNSLATIGGGTDTATFTSIWIDSVAILLGGIGAVLVGFAGFKYLRVKTRALPSYTPATPKA